MSATWRSPGRRPPRRPRRRLQAAGRAGSAMARSIPSVPAVATGATHRSGGARRAAARTRMTSWPVRSERLNPNDLDWQRSSSLIRSARPVAAAPPRGQLARPGSLVREDQRTRRGRHDDRHAPVRRAALTWPSRGELAPSSRAGALRRWAVARPRWACSSTTPRIGLPGPPARLVQARRCIGRWLLQRRSAAAAVPGSRAINARRGRRRDRTPQRC
jgi:hypothetical protein